MLDIASNPAPKAVPSKLFPINVIPSSPFEGHNPAPSRQLKTAEIVPMEHAQAYRAKFTLQQPLQILLIFESTLAFSSRISASIRRLSLGSILAPTVAPPDNPAEFAVPRLLVPGGEMCA
jgi:hypothetical protein